VISSLTVKWRTDYIPGVADGAARKSSVSIYRLSESMEEGWSRLPPDFAGAVSAWQGVDGGQGVGQNASLTGNDHQS
jgi:hypothetical protein